MKKVFVAILALALLAGAVSCKKDDPTPADDPTEEGGGNQDSDTEPSYQEGIYNPWRHITCLQNTGTNQQWSWNSGTPRQLTAITDQTSGESYTFTYKNSGLLATATHSEDGNSYLYTYSYDDGELDRYTIKKANTTMAEGEVSHNTSGKITSASYDNFHPELCLSMIGYDMDPANVTLTSSSYNVAYTWVGDNVSQVSESGSFAGKVAMSELIDYFGDELTSGISSYANIVMLFLQEMGDEQVDYTVSVTRSTNYTYDTQRNPFRGFWGEGLMLNDYVLSANNCTASTAVGNGTFNSGITISLPEECPSWVPSTYQFLWSVIRALLNNKEIPINRTIPLNKTLSYTYQYNDKGFPTSITCGDVRTAITYAE